MTNTTATTPADTAPPSTAPEITAADVTAWVERYLAAWTSNDAEDIAALFTEDGEYHEAPYETDWIGRDEIVDGWQGRWAWQQGGWRFEWTLVSLEGRTAVITGIGHYRKLGDFDNHWTITFSTREQAAAFEMINNERDEEG
ncbi:ketosteroid isomerase-like protein [Microbacterium sp. W4I4]|uniref:nuclear transport factor 2 family protein n=1 Tax=Microbacterium sp. W4I4 TaxID=3042295 RepID=UPI00277F69ED|nr:nuclear transport factor 2 family protein [Microbacterium sp. W4I4]MDQ0614383.1 ketosteroid isomerase-like protein [Microbacterium sp. W4I4]